MAQSDRIAPVCGERNPVVQGSERRGHQRHLTTLRVARLGAGDGEMLGIVRNISNGGMMIDVGADVALGGATRVAIDDAHDLSGRVAWQDGPMLGFQFHETIDLSDVLSKADGRGNKWVRRKLRVATKASITIDAGGDTLSTNLIDISQNGAKVAMVNGLKPNAGIVLSIEELGRIKAMVRWTTADHAGLKFTNEIPLDRLIVWLAGRTAQSSDRAAPKRHCDDPRRGREATA